MSLPSWIPPPHLPTHPTSLSCHRTLSWAPCIIQQIPTCYLFLHMVMYLFPCCSLNLSHPFLPPVSTMSSLCLCLRCCCANRFISTIFLDFVCVSFAFRYLEKIYFEVLSRLCRQVGIFLAKVLGGRKQGEGWVYSWPPGVLCEANRHLQMKIKNQANNPAYNTCKAGLILMKSATYIYINQNDSCLLSL